MSAEFTEKVTAEVALEVVKPKPAANMRKSPSKASLKVPPSPSRDDDKHVPHYLKASTGSCHDLCKYGIKHEPRKLNPTFRRSLISTKPNDVRKKIMATHPSESKKKTDNKPGKSEKTQTPEKLFVITPIPIIKESDHDSSSLNLDTPSQMSSSSSDHSSINQAEEISVDVSFLSSTINVSEKLISKPAHLINDREEDTAEIHGDGYFWIPFNDDFAASLPNELEISIPEDIADEKESSKSQVSSELMNKSSIKENMPNDPCTEVGGVEASSKKPVAGRQKTPKASVVEPMSVKLKNSKNPAAHKGTSTKQANTFFNECPRIKARTPCSTLLSSPNAKTPIIRAEESSGAQFQEKSLTSNYKTKRDGNKLKVADRENGVPDKGKAIIQKAIIVRELHSVKKSISDKKAIKSVKPDLGQKSKSLESDVRTETPRLTMKKTAIPPKKTSAPVTPGVIQKQVSVLPKTTYASTKPVASVKPKKLVLGSSSSTSSGGLNGLKTKMKIINSEDKEMIPVHQSNKSRIGKVPSFKLSKHKNVTPATLKNQKKVGNFGGKAKSSCITDTKVEKIDLMAARKKLRKLRSFSFDRNDGNENAVFKWNQLKKYVLCKEVIERNFSIVIKGEIKKRHRKTASTQSLDNSLTPRKLNFSRGKVINPEPKNNTPTKLMFRRPTRMLAASLSRRSLFASTSIDPNNQRQEAQTVVLRHRDLLDKKEARGLFNNVIEETASKLVETKKSKVKALVGAFETVISLQESKTPVSVPN